MMLSNGPEIGDVDKGIVKRGEDAGYTEDIFTCEKKSVPQTLRAIIDLPTFTNLRAKRDVFSGRALNLLLGRHLNE